LRIAVVNWSRRRVGGTETYLGLIIPELARRGHDVAFWHETDRPHTREPIALPEGVPAWCVSALGARRALEHLRDWRPDIIYSHSLLTPALEAETLKIAPAVFFAHAYYGTCISGAKSFKRPLVTPCDRRFGAKCLLSYYPRRCGGLSPLTMLKLYRLQSRRLELLRGYAAVLTHSAHMHAEYLKHGLPPERVHYLSYYAHATGTYAQDFEDAGREVSHAPPAAAAARRDLGAKPDRHLLFLGRMEALKGGRTFVEALPAMARALGVPVRVTFAGDGPDRAAWERAASRACRSVEGLSVEFVGWVERERIDALYEECDLLVFPSVWPEPFGLAGPEAGLHGVPVAAFDVGGVSEWLLDGVNGYLAPGHPPTAEGLAEAVVKCLRDPNVYERLRRGAVETARQFSLRNHLTALTEVFEKLVPAEAARRAADEALAGVS
jgi:glycosyltransferase involved in cell wall biosynthesis